MDEVRGRFSVVCLAVIIGVLFFLLSNRSHLYAIDFYNSEVAFASAAPVVTTVTFDDIPADQRDGFFPTTFEGIIYDGEGNIGHTTWSISTPPYQPFGIPTSSAVLFSPAVGEDFFKFDPNHYVSALGFDLFRPYDEETLGGIINIDVTEVDGTISTFNHDQDGQWLFFGFTSEVGITQIRIYNSTTDNVLDTNFAFDNVSRSTILEPPFCVNTPSELQIALAAASSNGQDDVIQIVQGTYLGNFVYSSTEPYGLTIEGGYTQGCESRVVDPENTVLDAQNSGQVLNLTAVSADFVVEGLTLQNGYADANAGGLSAVTNGLITLTNNRINDNTATNSCGGIYSYSPSGTITLINNSIGNNTAYHAGAGCFNSSSGIITVTNNTIINNTATSHEGGGGYFDCTHGTITLINNTISDNNAGTAGGGGHFDSTFGTITLINNTISDNNAGTAGGGAYLESHYGTISIINNTLTNNNANSNGGGIRIKLIWDSALSNIYNNIIWNNTSGSGGKDLYIENDENGNSISSFLNLLNNDFDQSSSGIYLQLFLPIDSSNLDNANPLFVDPAGGDFHPQALSPCINTGTSDAPSLPATDKDGMPRIVGASVDMGAYEYQGVVGPTLVAIDIKPGSDTNSINPRSKGKMPVAILSDAEFDARQMVNKDSLTFGSSGNEGSLAFCNSGGEDVNGDLLLDLVCHFFTQTAGFQCGDMEGVLKGTTTDGTPIEGRDSVRIIPWKN